MNAPVPSGSRAVPAGSRGRSRVAIVLPCLLPVGGLERLVLNQAEQFLAKGVDTDFVFLHESQDLAGTLPAGSRAFNLGVPRMRQAVGPLVRYLRAERPDAVHATMWPVTCLAVIAHRRAGVPGRLVLSDHNPLSLQYAGRGLLHRVLLRASMVATYPLAHARVAVSTAVARDLARLSGLAQGRFDVIPNPVPAGSDAAVDASWATNAWQGWQGKRIITVGRLKAQKNHALLIRAFARLLQRTDARLMILGVGELAEETRRNIEAAGLSGKVLMPGHVLDPMPYYRSADLFALSSDYEGFGIVLVEALACGLPVVSTDCPGGPADILEGGKYGRLVPVGDEQALAEAMAGALEEPPDPRKQERRARDFDAGVLAQRYLSLLLPDRFVDAEPAMPDRASLDLKRQR